MIVWIQNFGYSSESKLVSMKNIGLALPGSLVILKR